MKIQENKNFFKYLFVVLAMCIVLGSLIASHYLIADLAKEERNKIEIWAEATRELASSNENMSINLIVKIINSNTTIPVILYDEKEDSYTSINIELPTGDAHTFLKEKTLVFKQKNKPISVQIDDMKQYVYYDDSYTLKGLQVYPYIQLGILALFILLAFLALLSTMKMEQDRLWVGLSKETAHQLGTPISSLLAWIEYLRLKEVEVSIVSDMEKDVNRLLMITDRFSKIGSIPTLHGEDLCQILQRTQEYLEKRISKKILFELHLPDAPLYVNVSEPLLSWVMENLTKNAVDAMGGNGIIRYTLFEKGQTVYLDIEDTGKGIPKSKFKTIFMPGYTTKQRGWGLGLSLTKRIIESYHKGEIYVKTSEQNKGTIFRIVLKKIE